MIDNPSQIFVKNHKVTENYDKNLKTLIIGLYSSKKEKVILRIN